MKPMPNAIAIGDSQLEDIFNECLDEAYGVIKIASYVYTTSQALKELDPIAYREEFNSWLDAQLEAEVFFEYDGEYYNVNDGYETSQEKDEE